MVADHDKVYKTKGSVLISVDFCRFSTQKPPQGPGFSEEEIHNIDHLEVWASSFTDPGEDYTDWKLFDYQCR
ncbi:MAG: hypothetical protein ACFFCW_36755, partial [Candidatus Hodarchaeota archaeon]